MRNIYLLYFFFLTANNFFAQSSGIKGKVSDIQNNPLWNVSVLIEGTTIGTATDTSGYYELPVKPGKYFVSASFVGYKKITREIEIKNNQWASISFTLKPDVLSLSEIVVKDERTYTASSSITLNALDFELRPKNSAQDMLQLVPGLITSQHAGGGKAEQIFLRGFDADHGTDVNISVDGIPVNMVSHAHGQGYADLHFVIPETVQGLNVQKGPYFTSNGDFSTAGSVRFNTIDYLDHDIFSVEGGNFGTFRTIGMLNLPLNISNTSAYIAGEYSITDGYFNSSQNFKRFNLFGKMITRLSDVSVLKFSASGFKSDWDASGQIPGRAIKQGIIDRFGSIDDTEGGETSRYNFNLQYHNKLTSSSWLESQVYLFKYDFNLFSNFTFYLNDPVNGDQIEQLDDRLTYGYRGSYSLNEKLLGINSITTFGTSLRADKMNVQLWNTIERERLGPKVSADVDQKNFGLYVQEELFLSSLLRLEVGLRADYFNFYVTDNLVPENSGNRNQTILSPKVNLVISPASDINFFLNYGSSFHSNDARVVVIETDKRTLPRATGTEFGTRINLFSRFHLSGTLWLLDLENEFVYVGDEGVTELSGRTRRTGVEIGLRAQITSWLWADTDLNFNKGRFRDEPDGADFIPLAPDFTSTGGLTMKLSNQLEGSIRYIHISNRPANEINSVTAKGTTLFDAAASFRIGMIKIELSVENIFNIEWNDAQFDTESKLKNESEPVSELHFTPGYPRRIKAGISLSF